MSRWRVKPSALAVLSCVFFLMLLIVILPDVDLPDTAFHRGTAPVLIHARTRTALVSLHAPAPALFGMQDSYRPHPSSQAVEINVLYSNANILPLLLHSLRC